MTASTYYHPTYKGTHNKYTTANSNSYYQQQKADITTQQWLSEQHIFDIFTSSRDYVALVHIPSCSFHKDHPQASKSNKKRTNTTDDSLLESTSKVPLNIGGLENVLFISTLEESTRMSLSTKRPMTKTTEMKRHSSHRSHYQQAPIHYHHPRRYSHPETDLHQQQQQQRYNHIIQPQQSYDHYYNTNISSSSSSNSNSSGSSITVFQNNEEQQRRMSIQSDAALSTELIRRFSSGSTTSTVATSISASSSLVFIDTAFATAAKNNNIKADHINDNNNNNNSAQTNISDHSVSSSPVADILKTEPATTAAKIFKKKVTTNNDSTTSTIDEDEEKKNNHLISTSNNNKNIPNNEPKTTQKLGHDPGHACDTMQQSPYTLQQKHNNNSAAVQQHPIWADPIKIRENPTRYESVKSFLQENRTSFQSTLPLSKPCTFYFSDSNNKEEYMSAVKSVFQCDTVWQFSARWRLFKEAYSKQPSQLLPNQNMFCFIQDVEPMWEDPVNQKGGRLTIHMQTKLDDVFEWILLAFIGAALFDHGVVGIVVSKRYRGDRIELWLDESATPESLSLFK
jgi:hypothetical protein